MEPTSPVPDDGAPVAESPSDDPTPEVLPRLFGDPTKGLDGPGDLEVDEFGDPRMRPAPQLDLDPGWFPEPGTVETTLSRMRIVFLYPAMLLAAFVMVVVLIVATAHWLDTSEATLAPMALGFAVVMFVVRSQMPFRLDTTDEATLAESYRVHMFTRLIMGLTPSVFAAVVLLMTAAWWMLPVIIVCSLIGLIPAAPTARAVLLDDRRLGMTTPTHLSLFNTLLLPIDASTGAVIPGARLATGDDPNAPSIDKDPNAAA